MCWGVVEMKVVEKVWEEENLVSDEVMIEGKVWKEIGEGGKKVLKLSIKEVMREERMKIEKKEDEREGKEEKRGWERSENERKRGLKERIKRIKKIEGDERIGIESMDSEEDGEEGLK